MLGGHTLIWLTTRTECDDGDKVVKTQKMDGTQGMEKECEGRVW